MAAGHFRAKRFPDGTFLLFVAVQSKSRTEGQNNNKRYFQRSAMSAIFPLHTVGVQYGNADVDAIFDVVWPNKYLENLQ